MSEVVVNGSGASADLDFAATKKALASSSTSVRLAQLKAVHEKAAQKCMCAPR